MKILLKFENVPRAVADPARSARETRRAPRILLWGPSLADCLGALCHFRLDYLKDYSWLQFISSLSTFKRYRANFIFFVYLSNLFSRQLPRYWLFKTVWFQNVWWNVEMIFCFYGWCMTLLYCWFVNNNVIIWKHFDLIIVNEFDVIFAKLFNLIQKISIN